MDGVIIDSHSIADKLLVDAANKFGCNLSVDDIRKWGSLSSRQFWGKVKKDYNLPYAVEYLRSFYKSEDEIEQYRTIKPVDGVIEFIKRLKNEKIKTGLATSASKRRMMSVIEIFSLEDLFDVLVCDEEVMHSKPDPEILLKAAERLKVPPEKCVVIEDSENGKNAARRAGMKIIGFKGLPHVDENMEGSDIIIRSFGELSVLQIEEL